MTGLLIAICSVMMLAGLAGVVLPILPGLPLAWLGLFIFAIGTGFEKITVTTTVVFFVIMLLTLALDLAAPMLGASRYRASRYGVLGAFAGFAVGLAVLGLWGLVLGPFVGALLGELLAGRRPERALRSAFGAFVGFLAGTLLRMTVVLIMMGFFIASLF